MKKVQFGCGGNRINGWDNFDHEVNITQSLPFSDNSVDRILIEHTIEHVSLKDAYYFFGESKRILKPGGVIRIAFPNIVQVFKKITNNPDLSKRYSSFSKQFGGDGSPKYAVENLMFCHGHQVCWTYELMQTVLFMVGYSNSYPEQIGHSNFPEFNNIEHHHTVIGKEFNELETSIVEAIK